MEIAQPVRHWQTFILQHITEGVVQKKGGVEGEVLFSLCVCLFVQFCVWFYHVTLHVVT
jgi:hypothetical protein